MAEVTLDPQCNNAQELISKGVRALILQDYPAAVSALSAATELLVKQHQDDLHESLGDVYLYYGKALLGNSREENQALGDAVPKNVREESEDDEEQEEGVVEPEESDPNKKTETSDVINGETETKDDKMEAETSSKEPVASSSTQENDNDEGAVQQDDDDDLQLAWEVLELAKKIFTKQDHKKNLAEVLVVLGEISLENENFQTAIEDIKQGLEIQRELFSKDSRTVAETLFKLGLAYSTNSQIEEAVNSFSSSLECLRNRIKCLEENKTMTEEEKEEVEEINNLIPDIEERITDMKAFKEETLKKLAESIVDEPSKSSTQNGKQATDISHLVKRKRNPDDDKANEENPSKKPSL